MGWEFFLQGFSLANGRGISLRVSCIWHRADVDFFRMGFGYELLRFLTNLMFAWDVSWGSRGCTEYRDEKRIFGSSTYVGNLPCPA